MKRFFKLIICLLCLSFVFTMSSCNDGSIDELYGIYGLSSLYYQDEEKGNFNYADAFDYIVLVVNEDGTLDCYIKLHGLEEEVKTYKYTVNMGTTDEGKQYVSSITVENFFILKGYKSETQVKENNYELEETGEVTINFGKLTNALKFKKDSSSIEVKPLNYIVRYYRNNYSKLFKRINDFNLNRAKNKQIRNREERLNKVDTED